MSEATAIGALGEIPAVLFVFTALPERWFLETVERVTAGAKS